MKKILIKILAIALICVITLTSMGAYGGHNERITKYEIDGIQIPSQ